ncbi:hypothetical protein OESDEN_02950 [Oesophagostomum dentatum]|uniref:Uncharacterized protein n=1 Tax=Oesophagostomum dentatum TaxID=61180 RepID=A0A0B1TIJ8_OESDE|nr:hypothetical protein OESDEN_02950 [Oesophagostomum dentatum]
MNAYALLVCTILAMCITFGYAKPQCASGKCAKHMMRGFW